MPTKSKIKPVNRRKNMKKRTHRSWIWWSLVIVPIAMSLWLFAEPSFEETKMALKTTSSVERVESPTEMRSRRAPTSASSRPRPQPSEQPEDSGVINEGVKDDVDWAMGHMYKLLPIVVSLIAILKKGAIMGRSS